MSTCKIVSLIVITATLLGCGGGRPPSQTAATPTPKAAAPKESWAMLETAILNVQGHTGLDHCQVNVVSVEEADLPAASLDPAGQNTAGQTPTERDRQADPVDEQAFIRGYILTLEGTGRVFTFHAADDRVVLVDVQP